MLALLKQSALVQRMFAFNQYGRDRWVSAEATRIPPGSRVLDVGAGSCPYRHPFSHRDYRTHDFQQLQPNQFLGRSGYGRIGYISDITSIPVPADSFAVLLCTEVLEHIPEPILAVKEFARIVTVGGKLLLTAPLGPGLHQEPYHFYGGYTPHWYQKSLPEAGFEQLTIQRNGGFFLHYGQESLRFVALLAPWRSLQNLIFLPIWVFMLPWCLLAAPFLVRLLDPLDRTKEFTVGYFVTAVKSG